MSTRWLLATLLLVAALVAGCTAAQAPRERARSVVLTVAEGVRQADLACASVALGRRDLALAETCATLVDQAREQLITAEDGVDVWDAATASNLPCTVKSAAELLGRLLGVVQSAGGRAPPAVADALKLAPLLSGECHHG